MTKTTTGQASNLHVYLRLLGYVKPYWALFSFSILGFLIFASTQPMFAAVMQFLVDSLESSQRDKVYWVPVIVIAITLLRGIGSFLGDYYMAKVSNIIVHTLRCQIFDRYTILPNAFFDNTNSGHLLSRVTYNVTQVTGAATEAVKVLVREGLTVIGLLIYLFYMNWMLSLIFIAITPIMGLMVTYAGRRFKAISKRIQTSMGDVTHVSSELINGFRVVRSFGGEDYERQRFLNSSHFNYRQSIKMVQTAAIHTPLLQIIVAIAMALMIFLALRFMETATTGEFVAFITAAGLIPKPIRQLSSVNAKVQTGIAAAESIFEVLDEPPEEDLGTYTSDRVKGKIEIKNLTFQYPETDEPVLKNINLTIEPGMSVALVGQSGSGKTTLSSLIPRFYNHQSGNILLDGVEIQDYTLKNLRHHIALVTQHVTLFNDTIANNIAYGDLCGTPLEAIIEAAERANAMEFIEQLPEGMDTMVGENGVKLSGGQRQRLAIARALLKDAPVLILDEATSALDTESERKIQNALETAIQGRTTLTIAHRLSTIENADLIVVMEQGEIIEAGSHEALIARTGAYANLYNNFTEEQA